MKYVFPLGVALTAAALMGLGCDPTASIKQKIGEKVTETVAEGMIKGQTGMNVDINNNGNALTVQDPKTGNTAAYGEDVQVPADFPKDVVLYPGAKTLMVVQTKQSNEAHINQSTTDSGDKVYAWYQDAFTKAGFTVDSQMSAQGFWSLSFKKDKVTMAVVIAAGDQGGSTVSVSRQESTDQSSN